MVNVTASKEPKEGVDFFPLSVDYEEKMYSVGKYQEDLQEEKEKLQIKQYLYQERLIDQ